MINFKTTGIINKAIGMAKIPPTVELITAAPIARGPSPFWFMGKPSIIVAALDGVPGMFNKIADTLPEVDSAAESPNITSIASDRGIPKIKGKASVNATTTPSPGRMPKTRLTTSEKENTAKAVGSNR